MGLFARICRYPLRELAIIAALAILLPMVDVMLRSLGFKRMLRLAMAARTVADSQQSASAAELAAARRLAALARAVGEKHLWRSACLPQTLLVVAWLRRRGLDARLRIGVLKPLDQAPAHAWAEVDGIGLDPDADRHRAFAENKQAPSSAAKKLGSH